MFVARALASYETVCTTRGSTAARPKCVCVRRENRHQPISDEKNARAFPTTINQHHYHHSQHRECLPAAACKRAICGALAVCLQIYRFAACAREIDSCTTWVRRTHEDWRVGGGHRSRAEIMSAYADKKLIYEEVFEDRVELVETR